MKTFSSKLEIDIVNSVLDKYREELGIESSLFYSVFNCFSGMEQTENNFIIFYSIFADIYSGVFTLEEIVDYIEDNNLQYTIESLDQFLNNKYNSIQRVRKDNIYRKVLFGKYSNGVLVQFFQSLYDKTFFISKVESSYPPTFIISEPETSAIFNSEYSWLLFPAIDYFEGNISLKGNPAFRNIVDAEYNYSKNYKIFSDVNKYILDGITTKNSLSIKDKVLEEKDLEWFTVDRTEPIFLLKPVQKPFYLLNSNLDKDFRFALHRHNSKGITTKELFMLIESFIDYYTVFLIESGNSSAIYDTDLHEDLLKECLSSYFERRNSDDEIILDPGSDSEYLKEYIFYYWMHFFFKQTKSNIFDDAVNRISTVYADYEKIFNFSEEIVKSFLKDNRFSRGG